MIIPSRILVAALLILVFLICFGCSDDDDSEVSVSYAGDLTIDSSTDATTDTTSDSTSDTTTETQSYSIGGTINNLSGSGLVLLNNGGDELSIAAGSTSFTFGTAIEDGSSYQVTVKTNATGQGCTVSNGNGTVSSSNVSDVAVNCSDISVSALYSSSGENWMDYVKNNGTTPLTADDTACVSTEKKGYFSCLHGGEMRTVPVTGISSCSNLNASDSLGAFKWSCDNSTNPVRMVSIGFRDGKYLSDLINFTTPAWKAMSVTVYLNGVEYINTNSETWWSNTLTIDNDGADMNIQGVITLVTSDVADAQYAFDNNKVGLVVKPGVTVTRSSSYAAYVHTDYIWLEGTFIGGSTSSSTIYIQDTAYGVFRNVRVTNEDLYAMHLYESGVYNNYFSDITVANCSGNGIYIQTSPKYNIFKNLKLFNNAYDDIMFTGLGTMWQNNFINVTVANSRADNAINVDGGIDNIILKNVTAMNNGIAQSQNGMYMASQGNLLSAMTFGSSTNGIDLSGTNYITIENLAIANTFDLSGFAGIGLEMSNADNNYFTGLFKLGNNAHGNCSVTSSDGMNDSTCTKSGNSDFTLSTGINLASSFLAKVTSDSVNSDEDTLGQAGFDTITDWFYFENDHRTWGENGLSFPDLSNTGRCLSGHTCQIWDWSLDSSDSVIRNALAVRLNGDAVNTLTHKWFLSTPPASQSDCDNAVPGSEYTGNLNTGCQSTFLRNASEIIGDKIGNENGLCESNEVCLYTPNIGSYQGHGSLVSAGDFTDGDTLIGITLKQYNQNGR